MLHMGSLMISCLVGGVVELAHAVAGEVVLVLIDAL